MVAPEGPRLRRLRLAAALCTLAAALPAAAQLTPAGPEFAVSGDAVSVNPGPALAGNDRGETVAFWLGDCGGTGVGVCARAYDGDGVPATGEVFLDLPLDTFQRPPAAALGPTGRLLAVWIAFDPASRLPNLYARLFARNLTPLGGAVLVAAADFASRPSSPAVAALPGGGAVVVWTELGTELFPQAIRGRRLDAAGHPDGDPFQVDGDTPDFPDRPAIAADAAGRVVVAWDSITFSGSLDDVRARVFDVAGLPLGDEFVVHQQTAGNQEAPAVAAAPGGDYLVAWVNGSSLGGGPGIYARKVSAAGPLGVSETRVSPATAGVDSAPAAAGSARGFAVAWQTEQGAGSTVWLRSLDLAGVGQGAAQPLASIVGFYDDQPAVVADGAGNVGGAWNRRHPNFRRQIFARRFAAPPPGACADLPTALCLGDGRFQVEVVWHDQRSDDTGAGTAIEGSDQSGFFWFFNEENLELVVKALDGRPVNGYFWIFYGALSDVEYTLTVTDVLSGERRFYDNPPGNLCGTGDTSAFPLGGPAGGGSAASRRRWRSLPAQWPVAAAAAVASQARTTAAAGTCAADAQHLCLLDGRFRVGVDWHDQHNGGSGVGTAIPGSDQSGFFWFFDEQNLELVVKALDGRPVNGHYWIFYGALSDVEYTITVTDTETGAEKKYLNAPGDLCGRGDTVAF